MQLNLAHNLLLIALEWIGDKWIRKFNFNFNLKSISSFKFEMHSSCLFCSLLCCVVLSSSTNKRHQLPHPSHKIHEVLILVLCCFVFSSRQAWATLLVSFKNHRKKTHKQIQTTSSCSPPLPLWASLDLPVHVLIPHDDHWQCRREQSHSMLPALFIRTHPYNTTPPTHYEYYPPTRPQIPHLRLHFALRKQWPPHQLHPHIPICTSSFSAPHLSLHHTSFSSTSPKTTPHPTIPATTATNDLLLLLLLSSFFPLLPPPFFLFLLDTHAHTHLNTTHLSPISHSDAGFFSPLSSLFFVSLFSLNYNIPH